MSSGVQAKAGSDQFFPRPSTTTHICLEFELLGKSPLIALHSASDAGHLEQLATALDHLGTIGIIHADLKSENMLTGQGMKVEIGLDTQTLWYRSPEIMLGLLLTGLIDMWSLGCVVATQGRKIICGDTS
ncbi:Homeodomain-interacting protein kinase 3 [Merluccius polli]|uniref:Homeodomain-interacting protein kinase 3 n=1 Tax=Merluccius polli TaxID=89951 RepID=A0AA47MNC0_MERPO|nr:Homeodomain-interacting protein kinase 3 [Merluccius polli]